MILYGFMQDKHWYEDLAHIFIGMVPMWGWIREHRQWPPGTPAEVWNEMWAPLDRVEDSYRDFLGYAIGETIRTVILLTLLIT